MYRKGNLVSARRKIVGERDTGKVGGTNGWACLGSNYSVRSIKSAGTGASCQQCEYRKRRSSGARNRRK